MYLVCCRTSRACLIQNARCQMTVYSRPHEIYGRHTFFTAVGRSTRSFTTIIYHFSARVSIPQPFMKATMLHYHCVSQRKLEFRPLTQSEFSRSCENCWNRRMTFLWYCLEQAPPLSSAHSVAFHDVVLPPLKVQCMLPSIGLDWYVFVPGPDTQ